MFLGSAVKGAYGLDLLEVWILGSNPACDKAWRVS